MSETYPICKQIPEDRKLIKENTRIYKVSKMKNPINIREHLDSTGVFQPETWSL